MGLSLVDSSFIAHDGVGLLPSLMFEYHPRTYEAQNQIRYPEKNPLEHHITKKQTSGPNSSPSNEILLFLDINVNNVRSYALYP